MTTGDIETFVVRDLPVGHPSPYPVAIENGMFRSEIKELWNVCHSMEVAERDGIFQRWIDPMTKIPGGSSAYSRIAKELFYWRRGEGWKIKRKSHWSKTMKRLFPNVLANK